VVLVVSARWLQALKIDPTNMLILRDNSLLQIQIRDLEGFVETRRRILTEKPQNKGHWMAFALANHLNGHPDKAVEVIDKFQVTTTEHRVRDYEESELMLYKAQVRWGWEQRS
jgi:peptide alpha-N-acetyltransferase